MGNDQGFGGKLCEPFAIFDPATSSWRTLRLSLLATMDGTTEPFSGSWPRWGSMLSGRVYARQMLVPRTCAPVGSVSHGGTWPTPTYNDAHNHLAHPSQQGRGTIPAVLAEQREAEPVTWPTPTARDHKGATAYTTKGPQSGYGVTLGDLEYQARNWPTPIATDGNKAPTGSLAKTAETGSPYGNRNGSVVAHKQGECSAVQDVQTHGTPASSAQEEGSLNPAFVCWLMGFPSGWLSCVASGTRSSRKSRNT